MTAETLAQYNPLVDRHFRLKLCHPRGNTRIRIGQGALAAARPELARWCEGRTVFLVTSPPVFAGCGERLYALAPGAEEVVLLEVPDGETAKRVRVAEELWETMLARGGKRDSRLVTLGGGTVGDLGGFVAGCFLRGIEYVQLPTTLLAQVDAAVGGKTGVDLTTGKNSVGLFWHPRWVVAETEFLSSLAPEELRAGLMEVVKMAALLDPPLLDQVEAELPQLLKGDAAALAPVVAGAVNAKVELVEEDPEEKDRRRLLNFGHTLAHALETVEGYEGLRHGEAVGYGMLFALRLAANRGLAADLRPRLVSLLEGVGLPPLPQASPRALWEAMGRDKKARQEGIVWVLPVALGDGRMVRGVDEDVDLGGGLKVRGVTEAEVLRELEAFLNDPFA